MSRGKVYGGTLLVSGTTIGAGMLALPVTTGLAGFLPSVMLFIAYWLFMTFTAFLFLEVNLWMEHNANIVTMAKRTLGPWAQAASWLVYLFLLYCLTAAYIAGGGSLFSDSFTALTGIAVPTWITPLPLLFLFGYFIFKGTRSVDVINRILMVGLVIAFILLIVVLLPHEELPLLAHADWPLLSIGVSVVATSFGFHIIIPSLTTYLNRNVRQLKQVIFIGSLIPLIVYIVWNFLTLGVIPVEGQNGLMEGYKQGANGAHLLTLALNNPLISLVARSFSIFAIVTSFLGVSLSLMHFLADGLKLKEAGKGKALLLLLTFIPPLLFTLFYPRAFLAALEYAGAFGVILLLGVLPILMVWKGRAVHRREALSPPGAAKAL